MIRFQRQLLNFGILISAILIAGTNLQAQYKVIEVKHFTNAPGMYMSTEFMDAFYDGLRDQLPKEKITSQVVDEGAVIPDADTTNSLIIEGRFTEYDKGNMLFKPGHLTAEINIYRISDHVLLRTMTPKLYFKPGTGTHDDVVGKFCGKDAAMELKNGLKGIAMPPPGPPVSQQAVVPAASTAMTVGEAQVQFSSDPPGAEISIDGNYAGNTPSQIKVKSGQHSISVAMKGYATWVRSMSFEAGEQRNIAATLDKATQ